MVLQWLVCLTSLCAYSFISGGASWRPVSPADSGLIGYALWAFAIAISAYLLWSKNRIHTVQAFLYSLKQPNFFESIEGSTSLEMQAHVLFRIYRRRMLVVFVLCHSIALIGLIMVLVGADVSEQQSVLVISAFLLIYYYPSRLFFEQLIGEYERQEAARGWEYS
jgi:hypothetical protein